MPSELVENIRKANRDLREFIDQVARNSGKREESRKVVRHLGKINLSLAQISKCLARESTPLQPAAYGENVILEYRETLKSLRTVLERLQFSMLAEKARLDSAQANLHAACAWATSLRNISAEP